MIKPYGDHNSVCCVQVMHRPRSCISRGRRRGWSMKPTPGAHGTQVGTRLDEVGGDQEETHFSRVLKGNDLGWASISQARNTHGPAVP